MTEHNRVVAHENNNSSLLHRQPGTPVVIAVTLLLNPLEITSKSLRCLGQAWKKYQEDYRETTTGKGYNTTIPSVFRLGRVRIKMSPALRQY